MKLALLHRLICLAICSLPALSALRADAPPNGTLLFDNLRTLLTAYGVDNPAVTATETPDGPKGLAAADLDGDGRNDLVTANSDGTVAVLFGSAAGGFEPVRHLTAGDPRGLRDVITANVSGDARPEIIAAHPFEGKLYLFSISGGAGSRMFSHPQVIPTWPGARAVAAGDFNGDGVTDLAVGGAGSPLREFRGTGAGTFTAQPPIAAINAGPFGGRSARPVFTMYVWRKAGETRDRLTVSFAGARSVWFLRSPDAAQPLAIISTVALREDESVYDLALGSLSAQARATGEPDLLTAATEFGEVFIRHSPYPVQPQVRLAVPGGPRGLSIADVNADTWPDLLVASRGGNSVTLFRNTLGTLALASEAPAGSSPRDVVSADFDGNGLPDAAVINRKSEDITVHRIDPLTGWFYQSPIVQRVAGSALAPSIQDLDADGRAELLYLTPATGEANLQRVTTAGLLLPAVRYFMGARPQTLRATDLNADGLPDLLVTSLGDFQNTGGLSYRLQSPDHTFGELITATIPPGQGGGMFSEQLADFNGDGRLDLVAGFYDCRIAFFEGTATGLVHRRTEMFVYESRALVAVDADQDGDLDIVGVGAYGDLAVVENNGGFFNGGPYVRTLIGSRPVPGAYGVTAADVNGDGDPDLTILSETAATRWHGGPGLTFQFVSTTSFPPTLDATGMDFDGDGIRDIFALCPANTTASFFKGVSGENGQWWTLPFVAYAVPAVDRLAAGDLDADGRPDLVGAGEHLWIALSGVPAPPPVPRATLAAPVEVPGVVINEVLAATTDFIAPGADEPVDCVEIFNGGTQPVNLAGWKLRCLATPGQSQKPDFVFPPFILPPRGFAVVFCTGENRPWHAPFKLPAEGCTVSLLTASGETSNTLAYSTQQPDISYARLFDGARSLVFNPFPSIGVTNYDNGNTEPKISFKGVDTTLLKSGQWRFRAQAWDDNGMFTLAVHWREIVSSGTPRSGIVPLFDDGMNDDAGMLDGVFAGDWTQPLPPGTPIEFYVTGMDLRLESSTVPDGPQFAAAGEPIENYTLALAAVPSGWEISEVVPRNQDGLEDEAGETPDWAEIRYTGAAPANVDQLFLGDALFSYNPDKLYDVARLGATVMPGTTKVVFLDDTPPGGADPRHAFFKVSGDGDSIYLFRRLPSGATEFVDAVRVPALEPNIAYARLGVGGPFVQTTPTPLAPNASAGGWVHLVPNATGGLDSIFAFPGAGRVESSSNLATWTTVLPPRPNTGIEHIYRDALRPPQRFFRVR